jgi:hypothetical protein
MNRRWHPTKTTWAAARAREIRAQAATLRTERLPSADWRRIRGKQRALDRLEAEASRFERIARAGHVADEYCDPF